MTLTDLKINESAIVTKVGGDPLLRQRLLEMGITPFTKVMLKSFAPLGDPLELLLRGYVLSLSLKEAEKITVERVS